MESKTLRYFIFWLFNMKSSLVPKFFILFLPKVNLLYLPWIFTEPNWSDNFIHLLAFINLPVDWKLARVNFTSGAAVLSLAAVQTKKHWISFFSSISFLSKGSLPFCCLQSSFLDDNLHWQGTSILGDSLSKQEIYALYFSSSISFWTTKDIKIVDNFVSYSLLNIKAIHLCKITCVLFISTAIFLQSPRYQFH